MLTDFVGRLAGAVSDERWKVFERAQSDMEGLKALLKATSFSPQEWDARGVKVKRDGVMRS